MNILQHIATIPALILLTGAALAQQNIVPAGGEASGTGGSVSFSIGQLDAFTVTGSGGSVQHGLQQPAVVRVRANIIAMLQGPYDPGTGLMSDGLRANDLIPSTEPYTAMGFPAVHGGDESIAPAVLTVTGDDAIIDWVHLQLRDDDNVVIATRNALLQADGDIVDTDGSSPVRFAARTDLYHIAVMHRNHLSIMSLQPIALNATPATVNFSSGAVPTYGTDAQAMESGTFALWSGDVNADGMLKYTGQDNDRDPILVYIGGTTPNNTEVGYAGADVNMDGIAKYTGPGNDRDPILVNVGGTVPTNVREAQLPE